MEPVPRGNVERPTPDDFVAYLPWVCGQLQFPEHVVVKRVLREEYVTPLDAKKNRGKLANLPSQTNVTSTGYRKNDTSKSSQGFSDLVYGNMTTITIIAVYSADNLVEIKFHKIKLIPAMIFKIIGLILQFHENLSSISINSGLNQFCLYELSKLVPVFNITDICLDGTFLREANYFLLLEKESRIKQLSLCRCSIDDVVLEKITSKLIFPLPASQTLSILNLSINRITDKGAISLAYALRSNRQLSYLNLSSNMITDAGAGVILDTLKEFPMNSEEVKDSKTRLVLYLRERNNAITKLLSDLKEVNEKLKKSQTRQATGKKLKTVETDKAAYSESMLFKKADMSLESYLVLSKDPFSKVHTVVKDGSVNSLGNNSLCYLNLASNNLSYLSLKKILTVLNYQSNCVRTPRRQSLQSCPWEGLIKVNIEGNPMPIACEMFSEIEQVLRSRLSTVDRKKKRVITK